MRLFIKCPAVLCCIISADFFKDQSSSHKIWILPVSGALIIIIITICIKRCKSHFHFPFVGWITQKLLNSTKLEQRMGHRRDTINCATHLDKGTDPGFFLLHSLVKLFTVMENNFTNLLMILSRIYRRSFANDVVVQRLACLQWVNGCSCSELFDCLNPGVCQSQTMITLTNVHNIYN